MNADIQQANRFFNEGKNYFAAGNWEMAAATLGRVIEIVEAEPGAHFMLGVSFIKMTQPEKAIKHLRRCLELKPDFIDAIFSLGVTLSKNGDLDSGEKYIARAASLGDERAKKLLNEMGSDYCRKCKAPVHYGNGNATADITFIGPKIGIICEKCGNIFCQNCVPGIQTFAPQCPECKANVMPLVEKKMENSKNIENTRKTNANMDQESGSDVNEVKNHQPINQEIKPDDTKVKLSEKPESQVEIKSPSADKPLISSEAAMDADGNIYKTVKFGWQVWTAANLKTTKLNDGTPIPLITERSEWKECTSPAFCWHLNKDYNKRSLGALYNWHAVHSGKLAPVGWHVPSRQEWLELENYLITHGFSSDGVNGNDRIAKSLAEQTWWNKGFCTGGDAIGENQEKNNRSGFSARGCGCRYELGNFSCYGENAFWWSSSEYDTVKAWGFHLNYTGPILFPGEEYKNCGYSIRLLKDN